MFLSEYDDLGGLGKRRGGFKKLFKAPLKIIKAPLKIAKKLAPVARKLAKSKFTILKKLHTMPLKMLKRKKRGGGEEAAPEEVIAPEEPAAFDTPISYRDDWGGYRPMPALPPREEGMQPAYVKPSRDPRDPRSWLDTLPDPGSLSGVDVPPQAGVALLAYLKENEPRAWAAILKRVPQAAMVVNKGGGGMHGLAQDDAETGIDWGSIINSAVSAGSGLMNLVQNQRIFKANLERAQQGKPPIPPQQAAAMVPPMRAAATVGLDPATRRMVTLLAVGGGVAVLGLGAVFMMAKRGGPSRTRRHSF